MSGLSNGTATRSALIHLNTAGAAIPAPGVVSVMAEYLAAESELGPYEAEARYASRLERAVYARLAELVGAQPSQVAVLGSATDAWCRIVGQLDLPAGSRIWLTPYEYAGNLIAMQRLAERRRCRLEVLPTLHSGDLDLDWMRSHLDERVSLVSLVHMPSGMGTVLPVAEVGALLAGSSAVYAVDACQTVGQIPVDIAEIGCHLLTSAGRKFLRGPRGSGFAYVHPDLWDRVEPSFLDLHVAQAESLRAHRITTDTAARLETAERNNAVVLGLLTAAEHALAHPGGASAEVFDALEETVRRLPGATLLAPGSRRCGIVSFTHAWCAPERIRDALAENGINGWVGIGAHTPLHLAAAGIGRFVRTSVHHYNSIDDVEAFGRSVRQVCAAA